MKKFTAVCSVIIALFACYRLYAAFFGKPYGKHVSIEKNKLFYTDKLSEADARRTGEFLKRNGFYTEGEEKDVQLDKAADTVLFKMVADKSKLNAEVEQAMESLPKIFSDSLFGAKPVNVLLCNDKLEPYRTIAFHP